MNKFIIDIGGTNIEYKVITDGSSNVSSFPVNGMNKDELLAKIGQLIDSYNKDEFYVGISSPTAVDTEKGYCNGISGIKDYENFNLYEGLSAVTKTKLNIKATNDGNASLLGLISENFKENKPKSVVMVSLGTGIGGALYIDGKLYSGHDNMSGEFGYPIWANNENISRNLSPVNIFNKHFGGASGKEIFKKYSEDSWTKKIIDEWLEDLSKFLSMITMFINPEFIVFHGGVAKNGIFKNTLLETYDKYLIQNGFKDIVSTQLKFFECDHNYGLLGAEELLNEYKL